MCGGLRFIRSLHQQGEGDRHILEVFVGHLQVFLEELYGRAVVDGMDYITFRGGDHHLRTNADPSAGGKAVHFHPDGSGP